MDSHLISIIVPVYNVENYLHKCIESLQNQTYKNLEIILVNDGSTDTSPEICDAYAKEDSRIKVIHKDNGGLSDARNVGIDASSGEYIMFLDSDDYIDKNLVEKAVKAVTFNKSDVVIWGYYAQFVNDKEEIISISEKRSINGTFSENTFKDIPSSSELLNLLGYAWNKLYKSELIKKNNFSFPKNISLVEDMMFNSEVLVKARKITFIEDPLVHYLNRPRESLGNKFYEDYFDLKYIVMEAIEDILTSWNKETEEISKKINLMGFGALKSNIIQLNQYDSYDKVKKKEYLTKLLKDERVKKILKNFNPNSYKDKLIKQLMKSEKSSILLTLDKLRAKK